MILNSYIHIADTERNITRKVQTNYYNKYRIYLCSFMCTTRHFTQLLSGSLRSITEMQHALFPTDYFKFMPKILLNQIDPNFHLKYSCFQNDINFIPYIHIADTERNITRKIQQSCYNKYTVHRYSVNIRITNCTTATVTTIVHDISR
jgi:hypothetical protein